ncbi:MAG: hypothetical protein KIT43_16685 [Bauldia sp.]|nr:hypothetical protein [Bauldia sp.]MCW5719209.1 hypothetical protein [Bauldia sp.]
MNEADNETAVPIAEQKKVALAYLTQAWDDAVAEGVESDVLAHAALFAALSDLIISYGEEAVAELAASLEGRIRNREFTLSRTLQ